MYCQQCQHVQALIMFYSVFMPKDDIKMQQHLPLGTSMLLTSDNSDLYPSWVCKNTATV